MGFLGLASPFPAEAEENQAHQTAGNGGRLGNYDQPGAGEDALVGVDAIARAGDRQREVFHVGRQVDVEQPAKSAVALEFRRYGSGE